MMLLQLVYVALVVLVAAMHAPASAQQATKEFTTRPVASYTFDTDPSLTYFGSYRQSTGSSFTWSAGASLHTGVVAMDGVLDFIDLNYFLDNDGQNMTSMLLGDEMAVEVWASWTAENSWSRLYDFGGATGLNDENIYIANGWDGSLIVFQVYNGSDNANSIIWYDRGVNQYNWQHVVTTVTRNPTGTTPRTAAILSLYLNGELVSSTTGFLPKVMRRPNSWIGRSNWEDWGDARFKGLFDDVFIYNYSLSAEAVKAHYLVPRVALFELTFSVDPRINMNLINNPQTTYNWQLVDTSDSSANQAAHKGHLVLAGNQFLDVGVDSGLSAVGTDMPVIGDAGWAVADNDTVGWTFETTIKFTELTANACVFDFFVPGTSSPSDRVALCFSQTSTSLLLTVSNSRTNGGAARAWDVLASPVTGRWYHIVVNIQPFDLGTQQGRYEAFVDGTYTFSTNGGSWLARPTATRTTYIGRTYNSIYLKAYIDSFRVYDYALTPAEVRSLYRAVSGLSISSPAPLYTTAPSISYTFDVDIPWGQRDGGTRLQWLNTVGGRPGVIQLIASDSQYVNLLTLPDRNLKVFPGFIGGRSISFEFRIMFTGFTAWQRVLDLSGADWGVGAFMDNIFIATWRTGDAYANATMVFAVTAGATGSVDNRVIVTNAVQLNTWHHIVATIKVDKTINQTFTNSAQLQLYIDGVLRATTNTATPRFLNRPYSWMGRSRYTSDGYLAAYIDAFHYYDYPLELEQARVHGVLPRPAMYELTFSSAPSTLPLMNSTTSYNWFASDSSSTVAGQTNHQGVLALTASMQQYIDLNAVSGPTTIGAALPMLANLGDGTQISSTFEFLPNQAFARYGMSLEFVFRYNAAMGANAKLFSCGSSAVDNLIEVAFQPTTRDLTFYVHNSDVSRSFTITMYTALSSTRWYHVVATLRPFNTTYGAQLIVYIDGQQVRRTNSALFPYAIPRDFCYLGRGTTGGADTYYDGVIDAFRSYDYVLNSTEAAGLYSTTNRVIDPNSTPITPIDSSTGSNSGTDPLNAAGSSSNSLSGGAIAGVVIACVVGVLLLAVFAIWFLRSSKGGSTSGGGRGKPHVELSEVSEVREESHEETA